MKSENAPETPATKFLRQHGVAHSTHLYDYEEHGGTAVSSRELNVDEHSVVKTLVMEDEAAKPLIVLMHGDCKVSTKELARQIGCKKASRASRRWLTGTPASWWAEPALSEQRKKCRSMSKKAFWICR